jgi:flagellar basal body rod protein FlgC
VSPNPLVLFPLVFAIQLSTTTRVSLLRFQSSLSEMTAQSFWTSENVAEHRAGMERKSDAYRTAQKSFKTEGGRLQKTEKCGQKVRFVENSSAEGGELK